MSMLNGLNGNGSADRAISKATGPAHSGPDALLDNVEIRVETFLGDTRITLAQLNSLKTGAIVTLDAALNETVELRVNGVTIAHGELVSVGDRFGVRIAKVTK